MTKEAWLSLAEEEQSSKMQEYIDEILQIKHNNHELSHTRKQGSLGARRAYLENLILDILDWESENKKNEN